MGIPRYTRLSTWSRKCLLITDGSWVVPPRNSVVISGYFCAVEGRRSPSRRICYRASWSRVVVEISRRELYSCTVLHCGSRVIDYSWEFGDDSKQIRSSTRKWSPMTSPWMTILEKWYIENLRSKHFQEIRKHSKWRQGLMVLLGNSTLSFSSSGLCRRLSCCRSMNDIGEVSIAWRHYLSSLSALLSTLHESPTQSWTDRFLQPISAPW
jgi:hypothetical protein